MKFFFPAVFLLLAIGGCSEEDSLGQALTGGPSKSMELTWTDGYGAAPNLRVGEPLGIQNNIEGLPEEGSPWVAYTSSVGSRSDGSICTVDSLGVVKGVFPGTCTITAFINADGYEQSVVTSELTIVQGTMNIVWQNPYGNSVNPMTLDRVPVSIENSPEGVPPGGTVRYTSSDTAVCAVDSTTGTLTSLAPGTCTISALVSAHGYGTPSVVTSELTVAQGIMTLAWQDPYGADADPAVIGREPLSVVSALQGVPSGGTVRYTSSDTAICTVHPTTGTLTAVSTGDCAVRATVSATHYQQASLTQQLRVVEEIPIKNWPDLLPNYFRSSSTDQGLPHNQINAVAGNGDDVYAATPSGLGISRDRGLTWRGRQFNGQDVKTVRYHKGTVYVLLGSGGGLHSSTDGGVTFSKISGTALNGINHHFFHVSEAGHFYITGDNGLSISRDTGATFEVKSNTHGLPSGSVNRVGVSGQNVYVTANGKGNGLYVSRDGGASFTGSTVFSDNHTNDINAVYAYDNVVVVGHRSKTIYSRDGGRSFSTTYDSRSSFNEVWGRGSELFVADTNHFVHMIPNGRVWGRWREVFNTGRGLPSNNSNSFAVVSPMLYVGSNDRGVASNRFHVNGNPKILRGIGHSSDTSFSREFLTEDVCARQAGNRSGRIYLHAKGECIIRTTVTRPGYRPRVKDMRFVVTDTMSLSWSDPYGSGVSTVAEGSSLSVQNQLTGAPSGATVSYFTHDTSACTVNSSTGAVTGVSAGSCKVIAVATKELYKTETAHVALTVQ